MRLVKFIVSVLPLFFPLYVVRFSLGGIPFSLPEVMIYLALAIYLFYLVFRKHEFLHIPRWTFLMNIIVLGVCFWAFVFLPREVVFEENVYQPFLRGAGIWKEWIFAPMVYFFLMRQLTSDEAMQSALRRSFLIGASLLSLHSILFGEISFDGRLLGHFSNPNYLALYLTPALWLALTKFYYGDRFRNTEATIYVLIIGLAVFLTRSYTAWVALSATILIFIFTSLRGARRWYFFLAAALFGGAILGYEIHSDKFAQLFEFTERSSTGVRLQIWQVAVGLWQSSPWTGIGLGMFQLEYWQHAWEILGQAPYEWNILHTHNLYLQWLVETGVLGLAAFLVWLGLIFRNRSIKRSLDPRFIMVLILIQGLWDLPFWKNDLALVFFFVAGLIATGHHTLTSKVFRGNKFGSLEGFPTLSLNPKIVRHLNGVYAVNVFWKGQTIPAVAFIGEIETGERKFEVHLFGLEIDLWGEKVSVKLVERLRDVEDFVSEKDLRRQVELDCEQAKEILKVTN